MLSRVFTYFTIACAVLYITLVLFIGDVVQVPFIGGHFFNEAYWSGLVIIPIVSAAYYFTGVATNFAAGLHITKQTKYLPLATGSAAIANVIMNILLIPYIGYYGAAWATFGAYIVSAAVMYYYSQRVLPVRYEWNSIAAIIVFIISFTVFYSSQETESVLKNIYVKLSFLFAVFVLTSMYLRKNQGSKFLR